MSQHITPVFINRTATSSETIQWPYVWHCTGHVLAYRYVNAPVASF